MPRFFNTAGPCDPTKHYTLAPESRLPGISRLIDMERYCVLHAPRQTGKTTAVEAAARRLHTEGRYSVVVASCEEAQAVGEDLDAGIDLVIRNIDEMARQLPDPLRPAPPETVAHIEGGSRLQAYLRRWSERSTRPVVLFLDEVDAMVGKTLLSLLRQIRTGYPRRPEHFPQAVVLMGMRDVRDYRVASTESLSTELSSVTSLHTASPFNIKDRSILLRNFTAEEVSELYAQHTEATGQVFTAEATALAYDLTRGQPWLVNALAQQIVMDPRIWTAP